MAALRALEIFVKHGEKPEIDEFLQVCLNLPCNCTEQDELAGDTFCTACDEKWTSPELWQNKQIKFKVRTLNTHLSSFFTISN